MTDEGSKVTESIQCNLTFIFIELLKTVNSLFKECLVVKIKNNLVSEKHVLKRKYVLKARLHKDA